MIRAVTVATTIAAGLAAVPVAAQHNHDGMPADHGKMMGGMKGGPMGDMKGGGLSSLESVEGEVRRVDKANGKVTLRHGEIKQLDMPPMTMVFEVSDKAMLDSVKAGDKVNFKVISKEGKMIVTEMKPAG
jgi:Cu/Ag efflux protein CusF